MTLAECQKLLSITEANQILNPAIATNTIVPSNTSGGGSCNYNYAAQKINMFLFFQPYTGGQLSTYIPTALQKSHPGATVTTSQQVNGVGDQAWFVAGSVSQNGISSKGYILYVVDGGVLFTVNNIAFWGMLGSSVDATIESEFSHLAQLVVSRL